MKPSNHFLVLLGSLALTNMASLVSARLPPCMSSADAPYDYIVVGSGAGGGPVAARLALNGFKVLVIEAGKDVVNYNTTIPAYLARATEDPEISLDYSVKHEAGATKEFWYPRAQGLGGSTIHNALITLIPHKYDFDALADSLNDPSWSSVNMFKYFTKIEKNLYIPKRIGKFRGRGYDGWLSTQYQPLNLIANLDRQFVAIFTAISTYLPPLIVSAWKKDVNDNKDGGGAVIVTKKADGTRSSVRDHLVATQAKYPNRLIFMTEAVATKVLLCQPARGQVRAYGVEVVSGEYLLPVQAKFNRATRPARRVRIEAKYEVIISAGVFQTPQILMLSGIGDPAQLRRFDIATVVPAPGVGTNLQDRLEMTTVWKMKNDWRVLDGCTFGKDPATDPCLKEWIDGRHKNVYSSGPAVWAHSYKSDPSLPFVDIWSMWGPGTFTGYIKGWPQRLADSHNTLVNVVLKGHTSSKGWVRLTGRDFQDKLEINMNQFADTAGLEDLDIMVAAVKKSREFPSQRRGVGKWVVDEVWPGPWVQTDEELKAFIRENSWGHHACCTAHMGPDSDPYAVVDKDFKVKGVSNLRVVDNSVWANIPGFFVTTPIYMISEKAADVITAFANTNGWEPRA